MGPTIDPGCEHAQRVMKEHARRARIAQGLEGSRLWELLEEQREALQRAHLSRCERCQTFGRTCRACGVDLGLRAHRFLCRENPSRWRSLFGRASPPLAHLLAQPPRPARPRPAAAAKPSAPAARRDAAPPPPRPVLLPKKKAPHVVLEVAADATLPQVQQAYRKLVMRYHPDRTANLPPEFKMVADERIREVNAAYEAMTALLARVQ